MSARATRSPFFLGARSLSLSHSSSSYIKRRATRASGQSDSLAPSEKSAVARERVCACVRRARVCGCAYIFAVVSSRVCCDRRERGEARSRQPASRSVYTRARAQVACKKNIRASRKLYCVALCVHVRRQRLLRSWRDS